MKWIDLTRDCDTSKPGINPENGVSSLEVQTDHLVVTGNLPHGAKIAPRSVEAADAMIAWLEAWRREALGEVSNDLDVWRTRRGA